MSCELCPRHCNIDRENKVGFCGESNKVRIARAALHEWEEPCISGENGSGTVFFSGCSLKCVFCQNYALSHENHGKEVSVEELSNIFLKLQDKKAHNINLVTPTHFVPQIIEAIKLARANGLIVPIVYNSSGYESVETIKMLNGYIDVYLPDFKYFSNELAKKYSRVSDYFENATAAVCEMFKQVGEFLLDENGMIKRGMVIRHLILPGCTEDSKMVIDHIYELFRDKIFISIMNQYTPLKTVEKFPEINRKVTDEEYDDVVDFALSLGIENAFIQEGGAAEESFIPNFDLSLLENF